MARPRKPCKHDTDTDPLPLAHPPSTSTSSNLSIDAQTLYKLVEQRQLLHQSNDNDDAQQQQQQQQHQHQHQDVAAPAAAAAEQILEAMLWTVSLAMLHLTFDVLAQHQYGLGVVWGQVARRAVSAWLVFLLLFSALHARHPSQTLVPGLPPTVQPVLRQLVFFVVAVTAGSALVHVTNTNAHLATQKRAPPLGCLWIWAVVELHLFSALVSLALVAGFLKFGGYTIG